MWMCEHDNWKAQEPPTIWLLTLGEVYDIDGSFEIWPLRETNANWYFKSILNWRYFRVLLGQTDIITCHTKAMLLPRRCFPMHIVYIVENVKRSFCCIMLCCRCTHHLNIYIQNSLQVFFFSYSHQNYFTIIFKHDFFLPCYTKSFYFPWDFANSFYI